jgi:hypothetical protein
MDKKQIKVGDVVSITSESMLNDGIKMTVMSVSEAYTTCIFWDDLHKDFIERKFPLNILVLIKEKE